MTLVNKVNWFVAIINTKESVFNSFIFNDRKTKQYLLFLELIKRKNKRAHCSSEYMYLLSSRSDDRSRLSWLFQPRTTFLYIHRLVAKYLLLPSNTKHHLPKMHSTLCDLVRFMFCLSCSYSSKP